MSDFYGLWTRGEGGAFAPRKAGHDYFEIGPVEQASLGGEAIALAGQSTSDYFAFAACVDGHVRRHLEYDGSEGWVVVAGEPEPWEARVFFSERMLRQAREIFGETPEALADVERFFAEKTLVAGSLMPLCGADYAEVVMKACGLAAR